jgi:glycosyltransferase involved in cell wall biosynthesis
MHSDSHKLITVGIPVYNGAKYISCALDSVLRQDYPYIDIVISDNDSTDSTQDICRRYMQLDSRIRYYRNEQNLGALLNFGRCVEMARGKWFTWLAYDDYFTDAHYLSHTINCLTTDEQAICCATPVRMIDKSENFIETRNPNTVLSGLNEMQTMQRFFEYNWGFHIYCIYGVFCSRALKWLSFDNHDQDSSMRIQAEVLWLAQIALKGRIIVCETTTRSFRSHSESGCWTTLEQFSKYERDRAFLGLGIRKKLLKAACYSELPWITKCRLVKTAASNFLINPWKYRVLMPDSWRHSWWKTKQLLTSNRP